MRQDEPLTDEAAYRESLDYLYGLQRFGIKLGLDNIRALLADLEHPQHKYRVIQVGGTNGKGSVAACTAEILRCGGYRVGLYTSPHLHSFTERIRIDGRPITESEVVRLTAEIRRRTSRPQATFFEFTTALALLYFARQRVDFAVLEVGMGGRLDATTAVDPEVAVVTSVCRDHAEYLGDDLAAIAGEKAGILKPAVPVVIGSQEPVVERVLADHAKEIGTPAYFFGRDFSVLSAPGGFSFSGLGLDLIGLRPALAGVHQHRNLALALAAVQVLRLRGTAVAEKALFRGVAQVRWPGRLEWWRDERKILLDGAHNEGGARALADYLGSLPIRAVRWVVGLKADKAAEEILAPLLRYCSALYCTCPPVESAVDPERLARLARNAGVDVAAFADPGSAFGAALNDCKPDEIVLVAGSLFLVAAAREFLQNEEKKRS